MMNGYPSSVTSSPVSMQSSYDGEIGQITGFGVPVPPNVLHSPEATTAMPPKRELIRIREYNLHQLANLADKVSGRPNSLWSARKDSCLCPETTQGCHRLGKSGKSQ